MTRLERPRRRPPALVLFDLDDVLACYDRRVRLVELARRSGTSPAAVQAALFDSGWNTKRTSACGPRRTTPMNSRAGWARA